MYTLCNTAALIISFRTYLSSSLPSSAMPSKVEAPSPESSLEENRCKVEKSSGCCISTSSSFQLPLPLRLLIPLPPPFEHRPLHPASAVAAALLAPLALPISLPPALLFLSDASSTTPLPPCQRQVPQHRDRKPSLPSPLLRRAHELSERRSMSWKARSSASLSYCALSSSRCAIPKRGRP